MMSAKLLAWSGEHSGWLEQPPPEDGNAGLHVSAPLLQNAYPNE